MRVLLATGLVLLGGGLLVGLLPRSAGSVSCGSAFRPSGDALSADFGRAASADRSGVLLGSPTAVSDRCGDLRSAARLPAVALLVLGAAGVAGGMVAAAGATGRPREAQEPGVT